MNYWQIFAIKTNKQSENLVTARWFNILQSCRYTTHCSL